jgi:hypothetical protein
MSSYDISVQFEGTGVVSTISENELDYTLNVVNVIYTAPTVTSVGVSGGATGLTVSNSPITTSGVMTIGGTLAVASGGTGAITADSARSNLTAQKTITSGTASPSGGSDGDIYLQYI